MIGVRGDGRAFTVMGLVAALIGVCIPFAEGVMLDVGLGRLLVYAALGLVYLALTQAHVFSVSLAALRFTHARIYLTLAGLLAFGLQVTSGEPFVQPLVFVVPFVHAVFWTSAAESAVVGVVYMALVPLGIGLGPYSSMAAMFYPTIGYGTLVVILFSLARVAVGQARQREYLERLVEVGASLTRDLELETVLRQVAAAGRSLTGAAEALVWLRVDGSDELRLAAQVVGSEGGSGGSAMVPLVFKGSSIGTLELRRAPSDADIRTLQPFADAAAVAIENARLYDQARITATLAERNRLARELHDTIAQGLTAVTMHLEAASRNVERDPPRARARLERAQQLARATLEDVRRSVWSLAAPVDVPDLTEALEDLTRRHAARTGQSTSFSHTGAPPKLDPTAAEQALRIVQEALRNVEKHSRATDVRVSTEVDADAVRIWVRDNGVGFDASSAGRSNGGGFGLISLAERARLANGQLMIESEPGAGTCITLTVSAS
jgi:signal transduction histidine kinase